MSLANVWKGIKDVGHQITNTIEGGINRVTGRESEADKRAEQYQINDQIKAYKDQTALEQQEIDDAKNQQDALKRQINEKQIRTLRNNFRPAGGYMSMYGASPNPIGNSNALPNKLGTS